MTISVIICTIDRIELIKKCLVALSNQTDKKFTTIIVDARRDEMMQKILLKQSNLNVIHIKTNSKSLPESRNIGVQAAQSDFLVFIDDDTIPAHDWIKNVKNAFLRHSKETIIGGSFISTSNSYLAKFSEKYFIYTKKLLCEALDS